MNNKKQVTRKNFLRWSGLAFIGSLMVSGRLRSNYDTVVPVDSTRNDTLQTMSRIRPARGIVERRTA